MSNSEQAVQEANEQIENASEEKVTSPAKQPTKADAPDAGEESRDSVVSSEDNGVTEDQDDDANNQKVADDETPAPDDSERKEANGHSTAGEKNDNITKADAGVNGTDIKVRKIILI